MIVRSDDDSLQLITQPDHARLAGAVMEHCLSLATHPRRAAILHAIAEHDRVDRGGSAMDSVLRRSRLRERLRGETGLSLPELVADYAFVRIGDLISLAFCTEWLGEHRFGDVTVRLEGVRVTVTPEIFANTVIPIEIAARSIPGLRFRSDLELQRLWADATTITLRGEVAAVPHF